MSVNRTDYIVFGWRLPYEINGPNGEKINFYDEEKYEPMLNGDPDEPYRLIIDGMMGEYVVFGKVITDAENDEGWDFVHLTNLTPNSFELKEKYREVFNVQGEVADPYLFIFSHFH